MKIESKRMGQILDTTANWERVNPILISGEIGIEKCTNGEKKIKVGDGMTAWKNLEYISKSVDEIENEIQTAKTGLQNQIDNIVITASDSGDVTSEVVQARVNEAGTNYSTLKSRLDAADVTDAQIKEDINNVAESNGIRKIQSQVGRVNLLQGESVSLTNDGKSGYSCVILDNLNPFDTIYITAAGANIASYRTLGWYQSNNDGTYKSISKSAESYDNTEIKVKQGCDTLVINNVDANKRLSVYVKSKTFESVVRVDDFGATGNGFTDDTNAIQKAMDYCTKGSTLAFNGSKTYFISKPIICRTDGITIDGNNATIKFYNTENDTGNSSSARYYGMFTFLGEASESSRTITAITKYLNGIEYTGDIETQTKALRIVVSDTTDLAVGQTILIKSGNTGANTAHEYRPSFNILCKIVEIHSDNSVYTDYATPFDFDSVDLSNATLTPVTPIKEITVKNLTLYDSLSVSNVPPDFENDQYRTKVVSGLGFNFAEKIVVENIRGLRTKLPLVMVQYGYNVFTKNIYLERPTFLNGGEGYAVHMCGVLYGTAENIAGYSARHVLDFSYSAFCTAREIRTSACATNGGFDLHGICEHNITVENSNVSVQLGNKYTNFQCMTETVRFVNCNLSFGALRGYNNNISFDNCDIIAYTCQAYSADGTETLGFNISDAMFNNCRIDIRDINRLYIGTGIYHKPYSITFNNCVFDKNGNTSVRANVHIGDTAHIVKFSFIDSYLNTHGGYINLHCNVIDISGEIVDTTLKLSKNDVVDYGSVLVRLSKIRALFTDDFDNAKPFIIFSSAARYIAFINEMLIKSKTDNQISFIETNNDIDFTADVFVDKLVSLGNQNFTVNLSDSDKVTFASGNILLN